MPKTKTSFEVEHAETEKYVEWLLEGGDPEALRWERVRRRTEARRTPMTRAELNKAARRARGFAADFVVCAEMGEPLWFHGDPARLLEIDFEHVDWIAVVRAFEAVLEERDWRAELPRASA